MLIPDWNSLDSVRRAHSDLEAAAIVFFALLVLFDVLAHLSKDETRKTLLEKIGLGFFAVAVLAEIIAYPFGQRNDALSEQVIGSLDTKAEQASSRASKALSDSETAIAKSGLATIKADAAGDAAGNAQGKVEAVAKRAEQVDAELAQAEYLMSARSVQNRDELAEQLKRRFKGHDIVLMSYRGDQEGWGLCTQLWYIAKAAEMKPVDQCGVEDFAIPGVFGNSPVSALVSPLAISGPNIQETLDIADLLVKIGRIPFGTTSGMPNGMLMIFVGVKPPFTIGQARGVKIIEGKQAKKISNPKPQRR